MGGVASWTPRSTLFRKCGLNFVRSEYWPEVIGDVPKLNVARFHTQTIINQPPTQNRPFQFQAAYKRLGCVYNLPSSNLPKNTQPTKSSANREKATLWLGRYRYLLPTQDGLKGRCAHSSINKTQPAQLFLFSFCILSSIW